jgi:hypothetical protein
LASFNVFSTALCNTAFGFIQRLQVQKKTNHKRKKIMSILVMTENTAGNYVHGCAAVMHLLYGDFLALYKFNNQSINESMEQHHLFRHL